LYARAGWLLGRINYIEGRPETALSFYEDVIRAHAGSEYWVAGLVGKAEALAGLQRYAASAESYQQAVEALRQFQGSLLVDQQAIRQSLRALATVLSQENRPEEACPFAQMATDLVSEGQTETLAPLVELQAQIHVQAADALARAGQANQASLLPAMAEPADTRPAATLPVAGAEPAAASRPVGQDPLLRAREHLGRAGDLYARLAHIYVLKASLAQEASWQSARCFDRAGLTDRAVAALRTFIHDYPTGEYTPEALHRLGAALQATGRIDEAIATYERLLSEFGRTPAAFASLVPLGRCYILLGAQRYDTAERVLLSIVEEDPARQPLFTPSAPEFRDALLELANLYMRWDKPERAIERLEQALALYGDDPEIIRMQYQLADAYRRSGLDLLADAGNVKQPSQSQTLIREAHRRLGRAKDLFDKVANRLDVAPTELPPTDQVYLRTSYLYRADCAFDVGQFAQAAELYGRVAWRWQNDTIALSAYVQIVRSYLAAGDPDAARSALARARWILRKIADSQFQQPPDFRTRAYWVQLFDWVEQSGLLASNGAQ
jgi:tetratricopeptide (TPR) repeat protein